MLVPKGLSSRERMNIPPELMLVANLSAKIASLVAVKRMSRLTAFRGALSTSGIGAGSPRRDSTRCYGLARAASSGYLTLVPEFDLRLGIAEARQETRCIWPIWLSHLILDLHIL
jgi:hypothetical protein